MTESVTSPADACDVTAAASAARALIETVHSPAETRGTLADWAAALGELQALADVVAAAQDEAIVRLAAIEPVALETGEVVETHRALGHVALDAPALVSGVLTVSAVHAERLVRDAVRRAADGPDGTDTCTGLGGLHAAMAAGRLDPYRVGVIAHELEDVPAEVAAGVVESVSPWFDREDSARLRRRVRRVLAAISPDLLRQRAVRARAASGLRRWVDEPGVDTWLGTFPSEEACAAWAAVDALAQRYVDDGTCEHVERARAKALTDLVTSNATVEIQVQVVAPAGATTSSPDERPAGAPDDLVAVHGLHAGEPVLVPRRWVVQAKTGVDPAGPVAHPSTGALLDADGHLDTDAYRPSAGLAALVRSRDGHCRFPGCHVAARFCDVDHVVPWPLGPTSSANLVCLCRRHHRVKQRLGWSARLGDDGTMSWTDPTGRVRVTTPVDHRRLVLPATGTDPPPRPPRTPDGRHSALEFRLEHDVGGHPPVPRQWRVEVHRPRRVVTVSGSHPPPARPTEPSAPPF